MKIIALFLALLAGTLSFSQTRQELIIEKYLKNGAYKYHYTLQGWVDHIDSGLKEDASIAVFRSWHSFTHKKGHQQKC